MKRFHTRPLLTERIDTAVSDKSETLFIQEITKFHCIISIQYIKTWNYINSTK